MLIIHNDELLNLLQHRYDLSKIEKLRKFLDEQGTFIFSPLDNGLYAAASFSDEQGHSGYHNVWVRDNVYIAHALYVDGQKKSAQKTVISLMTYFTKHRYRFEEIIEFRADYKEPMNRPHIRFEGESLMEISQKWAHAQNDALGYFLWIYCKLANEEMLKPQKEDLETLALFPHYFSAIRYWEDEDSGHWEEVRKIEASSIGVVAAALEQLKRFLSQNDAGIDCKYGGNLVEEEFLQRLIGHGRSSLDTILPAECIQHEQKKNRRHDAALLFLVYPLEVVSNEMAHKITEDVIENLEGDYGIRRYRGDSYWAADYKKKVSAESRTVDFSDDIEKRNKLLKEGEEAQWCIFDPIISIIYGKMYQRTSEKKYLEKQTFYLNRSLGQLTGKKSEFVEFRCPEAYYLEKGRYVPNDHTPLLWTQANLMAALKVMEENLAE